MKKALLLKPMLLLFALIVGSSSVWAVDETISTMATSGSGTNFTWTTAQNGGASAPALNSGKIRLYASNQITFTATNGKKFKTIKLTTSRNTHQWSNASSSPSGFDTNTYTWTASDETTTSVTITNNNTGSGNLQISQFDITYVTEGTSSVAKPTFSATGAVAAGTKITLSHSDADEIRYTTDGTNPTKTTGTVYSTPIEIIEPITIKAIAVKGDEASDVATVSYTISVADPAFNLETGSYLAGSSLTLTSEGNTIYYNLTTNGNTPSNPTSSSTKYTGPISLNSGSNKIKAIAYDAYGNTSNVVSRTFTGVSPVTLPFGWPKGTTRANVNNMTGVAQTGLDSDYTDEEYKLKFNSTNDYIIFYTDEKPAKMTIGVKMLGGNSTSKFSIQESTNGVDFTEVEQLTISGSQNDVVNLETTKEFAATTRVVKMNFIKGSNVGVGPVSISAESETITLNEACTDGSLYYGTYSSSKAFRVPSNLVVSEISVIDGELYVEDYATHAVVPANTGVMVSSDTYGDHSVTLSSESGTSVLVSGNMLKPSGDNGINAATMGTASPDCLYYRLTMHNGTQIGYWWGAANGAAFDLAANKAYLAVPSATGAPSMGLWIDDDTTGIQSIERTVTDNQYYTLDGRRVAQPTKGLYIVNGRKVIVK